MASLAWNCWCRPEAKVPSDGRSTTRFVVEGISLVILQLLHHISQSLGRATITTVQASERCLIGGESDDEIAP